MKSHVITAITVLSLGLIGSGCEFHSHAPEPQEIFYGMSSNAGTTPYYPQAVESPESEVEADEIVATAEEGEVTIGQGTPIAASPETPTIPFSPSSGAAVAGMMGAAPSPATTPSAMPIGPAAPAQPAIYPVGPVAHAQPAIYPGDSVAYVAPAVPVQGTLTDDQALQPAGQPATECFGFVWDCWVARGEP